MTKSSLAKALMAAAALILGNLAYAQTLTNVALSARGGVASASSIYTTAHPPSGAIDGDRTVQRNGSGGTWASATQYSFPDWLVVQFSGIKTLVEIDVFSVADSGTAEPTATTTFSSRGLRAFQVQTWNGTAWVDIPGGNVTDNNVVWRKFSFPEITTDRIRILVNGSANGRSEIAEVEAWSTDPVANVPPTVSLTAPADGTIAAAPATVTLTAAAADSDGSIAKVDFYRGTTLIGTSTASPYTVSDANLAIGNYSYTAVATDNAGATTTSAAVTVRVLPGLTNVALSANGGVASASSIYGTGYPPSGAIDGDRTRRRYGNGGTWADATRSSFPDWLVVQFNGVKRLIEIDVFSLTSNGTVVEPTLAMTNTSSGLRSFQVQTWNGAAWVDVPGGNVTNNNRVWRKFSFPEIATDHIRILVNGAGNVWSEIVEVEAWSGDAVANVPPTVSLTEPVDGAIVSPSATVTLKATASDSDGSIAKVDFYRGTALIGTTTASPYGVSDANLGIGNYSYTAVATDNAGARTTSTPVTVKVLNVGAVGTTTFQYDPNGNLTRITDPLGNVRQSTYDALERLIQITDPAAGVAKLAYDGRDQLTKATDPRNLATTYKVDGLGNASQQVSPDSGVTTQSFDAAGNPLTRTDARQQSGQTRYDALDRPIQIDYSDGRQTRYVWDLGQNGIGRLGQIDDYANGTLVSRLAYAYDPQGRLVRQVQTVGALSQSVASTYTDGRLAALTLPSGRTLAYRHDAAGRIADITLATSGLPLVQNAAHTADGRLQRWTDAAGQVQKRSHNLDGQVVAYSAGGQTWQLTYDSAGRLTRIADSANPVLAADYGYDALNRITRAVLPNTAYAYAYDANGNRKQSTIGGQVQTLSIDPASNRLLALASSPPIAYTYDPAGNRSTDGQTNYTYDAAGRLVQATSAIGTTRYQVNALNQRIRKTGPLGDTTYLHDRQGHLLAETDSQGRIQREYVWLDDHLLAILDGEPSATQVYAVHPDPLGTPRAVTDPTGKLVWRAAPASEPFGLSVEQDPDGDGTPFVLNLRFPGQYYDQETNLAYNWHRYYDERVGSYTTSDPIGLNGGQWSTYGYVNGNPLSYSDPLGLITSGQGMPRFCQSCHLPLPPTIIPATPRPGDMTPKEERYYDRYCKNTDDPCRQLKAAANTAIAQARIKMNSMLNDDPIRGLFRNAYSEPNPAVTGTNTTWMGHVDDLDGRRASVWSMIELGRKMGCDMSAETAQAMTLLTPGAPR